MNIVVNASDFLNDFYNTLTKEQKSSSYGKSLKAICSIQREKEIEEYSKIIQKEKDKNKEKEYYNYDNNHNQTSVYDSEMATFLLNNINNYKLMYITDCKKGTFVFDGIIPKETLDSYKKGLERYYNNNKE